MKRTLHKFELLYLGFALEVCSHWIGLKAAQQLLLQCCEVSSPCELQERSCSDDSHVPSAPHFSAVGALMIHPSSSLSFLLKPLCLRGSDGTPNDQAELGCHFPICTEREIVFIVPRCVVAIPQDENYGSCFPTFDILDRHCNLLSFVQNELLWTAHPDSTFQGWQLSLSGPDTFTISTIDSGKTRPALFLSACLAAIS